MNANTLRRLNWLWKHRHTHDGETTQQQINIIRTIVEEQADDISAAGPGAYIHLLSDGGQAVTSALSPVEWADTNAVLGLLNFATPSFPATEIVVHVPGYYDVGVMIDFVSAVSGASVTVARKRGVEITVFPPGVEAGVWTVGYQTKTFSGVAKGIEFHAGDSLIVYVSAASTVNIAWASLVFELIDRRKGPAATLPLLIGYRVEFDTSQNHIVVRRRSGGAFHAVATVSKAHTANTWYWMRTRIDGQRVRAKTWSGSEGSEPSGWNLDVIDTEPLTIFPGWAGLAQFSLGAASVVRRCDVFEVTNDGGTPVRTDFSDHTPGTLAGQGWTTVSQNTLTHTVEDDTGTTGDSWVDVTPRGTAGHHFIGWSTEGVGDTQEVLARLLADDGSVGVLLRGNVE